MPTGSRHKRKRRDVDERNAPQYIPQTTAASTGPHTTVASNFAVGMRPEAAPSSLTRSNSPRNTFIPGEPSPEYLALANVLPSSLDPPRKLVILDLNGTLLYRAPPNSRKQRVTHARPYLRAFTQFICAHQGLMPMIWSSARPDNVKAMTNVAFGPLKRHLKAIWARDTLELSAGDFQRKVQTVKDLNIVWRGLSDDSGASVGQSPTYSALNTILVDDSLVKAHLQPHNHICLPDYDRTLRTLDVERSLTHFGDSDAFSAEDAQIGISSRYDLSLIAVMGVLEELARQDSVCSWIGSGRLRSIPSFCTEKIAENGMKVFSEGASPALRSSPAAEVPALGALTKVKETATNSTPCPAPPYFKSTPTLWYEHSDIFSYWVSRGVQAAKDLRIPLEHGVSRR